MNVRYFDRVVFQAEGAGAAGGNGGAAGAAAGAAGTGAPWYGTIADEAAKTFASKYESRDKLFEAIGYKPEPADWRAGVPDDLKSTAERLNSPIDAIKAVADLRKQVSTAIRVPAKDAKPEEIAAFRKAMAVPETPDGYKFPALPEGEQLTDADKAFRSTWAKRFHDANVPGSVAESLINAFNEDAVKAAKAEIDADKQFAADADKALKAKWGADFDANKEHANRAAAKLFGDRLDAMRELQDKTGRYVLDRPEFVEMLATVGREMAEPGMAEAMTDSQRQGISEQIAGVRAKINEAQAKGDSAEANRLYAEEQALIAKRDGSRPPVGVIGRAA